MPLVDANIILRYLMNDHPIMSPQAREIILAGAETTPEVLAEVVYVLRGAIMWIVRPLLQPLNHSFKKSRSPIKLQSPMPASSMVKEALILWIVSWRDITTLTVPKSQHLMKNSEKCF